jgi:Secretory lipase
MTGRLHLWAASVAVCAVALTGGCAPKVAAPPQPDRTPATIEPPFQGAAVLPPADMTGDSPGSLLEVTPLESMPELEKVNATGVRVVYRSTGAQGKATAVSGVIVVPPGEAPRGGWPILSFGHDLIGVRSECAPSLDPTLGAYSGTVASLIDRGYVVAMTDYQGLGVDGFEHPLLDSVTLGNNMIDAARAARRVVPVTSDRWVALGFGQGGMATWEANERAATYGAGLELVAAAALSPFADLTGLADAAVNGTLAPAQYRLQAFVVAGLASSPGNAINPDEYFSNAAKENFGYLTNCAVIDPMQGVAAATRLQPGDFKPTNPAAAEKLRGYLEESALPGPSALSAPMLVVYATSDEYLPPAWIEQPVRTACARGDSIEVRERIGDITTLNDIVIYDAEAWLRSRLTGQSVPDSCVGV